jgi:hypothetical protein
VRFLARVTALGLILSYAVGWALHYLYLPGIGAGHAGHPATTGHHGGPVPLPRHSPDHLALFLRDATLAAPIAVGLLLIISRVLEPILTRRAVAAESGAAKLIFTGAVAVTAAAGVLFGSQLTGVALATLRYTFALTLALTLLFGVPWRGSDRQPVKTGELVS